jgi:hypothetical protein
MVVGIRGDRHERIAARTGLGKLDPTDHDKD